MLLPANRLSINVSKTFALHFTSSHLGTDDSVVNFNNHSIPFCNSVKFLGVNVDSKLKFHDHIDNVSSKIAKSVGIFYKLKLILLEKHLISLYYSLDYPYFLYCNAVWGSTNHTHVN